LPRVSRRDLFIGGLFFFAFWLFVALPFLYGTPRHSQQDQKPYACSGDEGKNNGFWEKAACDPTAYFTLWLVGFTGVLAVSTVGLWVATFFLYRAGKKQLGLLSRSTDISERALTELEAPFTAIKILDTGMTKKTAEIGHDFGILQFSITNDGRTPARLVEVVDKTQLVPIENGNPPPIDLAFRSRLTMPYGVISPPNRESQPFSQNLLANHMNELAAEPVPLWKKSLFFYGFIRYETIFKQTYRMGFCYFFDRYSECWILTGEDDYNYLTKES
jgi:hypothetical protein